MTVTKLPTEPRDKLVKSNEHRYHPRVTIYCRAEVSAESGDKITAMITDISRSGLRLEGDRKLVGTLFPNTYRQDKHTALSLEIYFVIPDSSFHCSEVRMGCSTVYVRRTAQDRYQLGVQFTTFLEGSNALADYLTSKGVF